MVNLNFFVIVSKLLYIFSDNWKQKQEIWINEKYSQENEEHIKIKFIKSLLGAMIHHSQYAHDFDGEFYD